ncbi:MAG: PIN domain-containing protein [Clostridia bacterium]|nr:PIN domain-containing protein [Clostridia bacterium]
MKLLIDTNIILDVLCKREPFFLSSGTVLRLCESGICSGAISALSVANLMYIMRKELDPNGIRSVLGTLSLILEIEDLKSGDLVRAADAGWSDYEDAVQAACAERIRADLIITRNIRDYRASNVPAVTPDDLLAMQK